jgi:hypothetical protein
MSILLPVGLGVSMLSFMGMVTSYLAGENFMIYVQAFNYGQLLLTIGAFSFIIQHFGESGL